MMRWMTAAALSAPSLALAQAAEGERGNSSPAFWIAILAAFIALGTAFFGSRKK